MTEASAPAPARDPDIIPSMTRATLSQRSTAEHLAALLKADARLCDRDEDFTAIRRSLARLRSWHSEGRITEQHYETIRCAYAKHALTYENIVARYTAGDCYLLAVELARRTGWPIEVCHGKDGIEDAHHAFVISPKGRCLDITGYRKRSSITKQFGCKRFSVVDDQCSACAEWSYDECGPAGMRTARGYARLTAELMDWAYQLDT